MWLRKKKMNNQRKSLTINAFINGLRTVLNLVFPLITFPYISRILSVDEIGKYNFSDSIVSYFMLMSALGINQYAVREGARIRESRKDISEFVSKVFSVNIISMILAYIVLGVLLTFSNKLQGYWLCIVILSTQIFFTTIGTEWLYVIYEEYTYITIRSIAFKIISIVLLFVYVRNKGDYLKYTAITVVASVGSNVLNFLNAKKYCDIRFTLNFDWKLVLKPVMIIFASNIAIQIYVNSDITMLGFFGDDYSVGIYSISTKIYTIIKNVLTAVLTVTIPRFSLYARERMGEYNELLQKVINTLIVIIFPAFFGLILLSKNVITIIAGSNYWNSQPSLCILSATIIFSVFNGLFSQCVLLPFRRENIFLKCTVISAVINVLLNFVFIPVWSDIGAAITTFMAELILCVLLYRNSRDIVKIIFRSSSTIKNLLSVLISVFSMSILCLLVMHKFNNFYLKTFGSIAISIIFYVILLIALKNEIAVSGVKAVLSRIKH